MKPIVIAAPSSGCGKTTVTLGVMAALRRRGLRVAPFKVGPDFIDPGHHAAVCGRPSLNLDGWICTPEAVHAIFARHAAGADVAVVEGVMGLFDGLGGASEQGSTAQVAKLLGAPVVLVVDARGQARSVAALVGGFAGFDPQVRVAGVIFNQVAGESHGRILREAMAAGCPQVPVLGCLPREEQLHLPARHLGLVTAGENPRPAEFLERLAAVVERHVEVDRLLTLPPAPSPQGREVGGQVLTFDRPVKCQDLTPPVRLAVARDVAFCFLYEENLRLLREAGAELVTFSPLHDGRLPEGSCGLYLPGGYPELHAEALAANGGMKQAVRAAVEAGMPVYAECGGLVYLTRGIEAEIGAQHAAPLREFVGIFPVTARMLSRRKALGYREVELAAGCLLGPAGTVVRGHEFHYSELEAMPDPVERVYRVRKSGMDLGAEGYRYRNCLASYVHLHFGSCPEAAAALVASCRKYQDAMQQGCSG